MTRIKMVLLCLVAAFAISAVVTSAASAVEDVKPRVQEKNVSQTVHAIKMVRGRRSD